MPDEAPSSGGWLPPVAPGGNPPPRFIAPEWSAPQHAEAPRPAAAGHDRPAPPHYDAPRGATNSAAVWALVLGIAGLALLLVSFGTLFFVTLPLSAAAWMMATRARAAIADGRAATGQGQANAALWLGRAGVIAGVAAGVALLALIASGYDFEELRRDLERELERRQEDDDDGGGGVRAAVDALRAVLGR